MPNGACGSLEVRILSNKNKTLKIPPTFSIERQRRINTIIIFLEMNILINFGKIYYN